MFGLTSILYNMAVYHPVKLGRIVMKTYDLLSCFTFPSTDKTTRCTPSLKGTPRSSRVIHPRGVIPLPRGATPNPSSKDTHNHSSRATSSPSRQGTQPPSRGILRLPHPRYVEIINFGATVCSYTQGQHGGGGAEQGRKSPSNLPLTSFL